MNVAAELRWDWLADNHEKVRHYLFLHARLSVIALVLGVLVAVPIGVLAHRLPRIYPTVLALTTVIYAIPSLTLIVTLLPLLGLNDRPVIVALALYTLVILVRNIVEGLRAVPRDVLDASTALGYRPTRRLVAVELPLASPAIVAGLRVASASTISLLSIGGLVGSGALGQLFIEGFQINNPIEVWAGIIGCVLLAIVFDLVLVALHRLMAPWVRRRGE